MKRFIYVLILLCPILQGCATSYSPGISRGYSEIQLDENLFQVSFNGNGKTSEERASDYALLRCAEVCLINKFSFFVIIDSKESSTESTYTNPTVTEGNAKVTGNKVKTNTITYGGDTETIRKPTAHNKIICYKDKPDGVCYNAKIVMKSIKEKYGIE